MNERNFPQPIQLFSEPRENREPSEQDRIERIAQAFLRQRYPVSEKGQQLKSDVNKILRLPDSPERNKQLSTIASQLPTVEVPHLDLYQDLNLASEKEQRRLFGFDLADIQIAKGCSRNCYGCVVSSGPLTKDSFMPFPALLKIAQQKRAFDEVVENKIRLFSEHYAKRLDRKSKQLPEDLSNGIARFVQNQGTSYPNFFNAGLEYLTQRKSGDERLREISIFYDNEPFDYIDQGFFHVDGTPAHVGDCIQILATPLRPIVLSTSGWMKNNTNADRAALALSNLPRSFFERRHCYIQISVNPYTAAAQRDFVEYRNQMQKAISLLAPLISRVVFRSDNNSEFISTVEEPLRSLVENIVMDESKDVWFPAVDDNTSFFSGRFPEELINSSDRDIAASHGGIHIWPDGRIAKQQGKDVSNTRRVISSTKGTRPQDTGKRIFTL